MDHTTRRLIDRVAAGKGQPVAISGYVGPDDEGDGRGLRIYPDMDANHYYVVDLKCPIEMVVIPDDPQDRVTVIVESASQIETVTRQRVAAATLAGRAARRRSHAPPVRGRDGVRSLLIALAKATRAAGLDTVGGDLEGAPPAAAGAWNRLLEALGSPEEAQAADALLASCTDG